MINEHHEMVKSRGTGFLTEQRKKITQYSWSIIMPIVNFFLNSEGHSIISLFFKQLFILHSNPSFFSLFFSCFPGLAPTPFPIHPSESMGSEHNWRRISYLFPLIQTHSYKEYLKYTSFKPCLKIFTIKLLD